MREKWIIDYKSSTGIYYPEMNLQLAAYRIALGEVINVGILRLDKETGIPQFANLTEGIDKHMDAFVHLRKAYELLFGDKEPEKGYTIDGKLEPSVTAILKKMIDKPALVQWSANETVDYFREQFPHMVTAPIEQLEYIYKKGKTYYRGKSKSALNTGSCVHDAIEAHLSGADPDKILDGNDKAQNAFLAFLEWEQNVQLEPLYIEAQLISQEYKFGGTVDFIGYAEIA